MSENWLNEITGISGVEGLLIVTEEGDIMEQIGAKFDLPNLQRIARHIMRIVAAYHLIGSEVREIELVWHDYRLLVMNARSFALIVFCNSTRTISLLRITLNVVTAHLLEDKKKMKKIHKNAARGERLLNSSDLDQSQINLISKLQ